MQLVPGDPLAHRALDSLLRAEANVRRRLTADLEREGISSSGFWVLVALNIAGGQLQLRGLRQRLQTSKANATEIVTTLESRAWSCAPAAARPPRRGRHAHRAGRGSSTGCSPSTPSAS